ncbi:DNA-binding protein [Mycetocola zhadangensis]|uniref:DNA-binding protein n=1 Tax=Mycetocola zhadangensis TaxID=1164595 RepID=A0A3L7J600_9MICO|nr:DNA-binding protein [Mycetocola zhadangensis]RLQ85964.1 DNA-binding protein [Mycetocola zhadangensis]
MSTSVPTTYPPARVIESLGDYLTVDELAEYLQLSKETICHWRLEGTGRRQPSSASTCATAEGTSRPG